MVGVPQAETERIRKVRGLGRYTADERFAHARPDHARPDHDRFGAAAFAAFVRSPHAHARIVAMDTTQAAAMPGVAACADGGRLRRVG